MAKVENDADSTIERSMERRKRITLPTLRGCMGVALERTSSLSSGPADHDIHCGVPGPFIRRATAEDMEQVRAAVEKTFRREIEKLWERLERQLLTSARQRVYGED